MPKIDINELIRKSRLNLSITSNQDEHPNDAYIRRFKDIILFSITIILILCAFLFCGYILLSQNFSFDTAIATSIISALLGYLLGLLEKRVNR
jgi:hypothetical protein